MVATPPPIPLELVLITWKLAWILDSVLPLILTVLLDCENGAENVDNGNREIKFTRWGHCVKYILKKSLHKMLSCIVLTPDLGVPCSDNVLHGITVTGVGERR